VAGRDRGLLLLVLAFALVQQLLFATIPDAAFTTFRYADNIAAGHGAVFNLGERVEGPANFVWLVLVTLPRATFGIDIARGGAALSLVCVLGCVVLAYLLGGRFGLVAAVLTAGVGGWAAVGFAGTETALFALLVLGMARALTTGHPMVTGVLAALAVMTRPEGAVAAAVAGLWLAAAAFRHLRSWWAPLAYVLGGLVFVVPWLVWRATYYGQPLLTRPRLPVMPASFGFLLIAALAVVVSLVCGRRVRPSPSPRRRPFAVAALALTVCAVSLPISAASWVGVAQRRAWLGEASELGSWLSEALPFGTTVGTGGDAVLAYAVGTRVVVADGHRTNTSRPDVVIGQPAPDCHAEREEATFRWTASGTWVTVYPRDAELAAFARRLAADPRLSSVPCLQSCDG
jgi:hypothetical protein